MIHCKKHDHSLIINLPVCLQRINHYSKRGDDPPQKAWPFLKHRLTVYKERVNTYSKCGDDSL